MVAHTLVEVVCYTTQDLVNDSCAELAHIGGYLSSIVEMTQVEHKLLQQANKWKKKMKNEKWKKNKKIKWIKRRKKIY